MKRSIARPIAAPPGRMLRALPAVSNAAPPTIASQTVLSDGVTLRLVGSVPLTAGSLTGLTAANVTMASASIVGGNLDIVITKVYDDQPVGTVTYDGTGTLAGASGAVAAFGPVAITNNSAQLITSIAGTRDLHKWTESANMRVTYDSPTPGVVAGDPIGYWMGTLGVALLETTTSTARFEYNAAGVLINAASAGKNLYSTLAQAATAPYFVCVREVNNAALTAPYIGLHSGTATGTGMLHTVTNEIVAGKQGAFVRATATDAVSDGQGDTCYVLSFDGTSAFLIDESGTKTTLIVGAGALAGTFDRVRAPVTGAANTLLKYRQSGTAAISEADARAWIAWAKGQP